MCPNIPCPASCAGRGNCDWSRKIPTCVCNDPTDTTPGCTASIPAQSFVAKDLGLRPEEYGTFVTRVKGEFRVIIKNDRDMPNEDILLMSHTFQEALALIMSTRLVIRVYAINGVKIEDLERRALEGNKDERNALNDQFEVTLTQECGTPGCEDMYDMKEAYYQSVSKDIKKVTMGSTLRKAIQKEAAIEGASFLEDIEVELLR
jgi:hypothetical protein